jgi:hypothetical protein
MQKCVLIALFDYFFPSFSFFTVNSLKDLHVIVPEAVAVGDTVILSCNYDLENEDLYSIRWYFEMEEFYRNIPGETPPGRIFSVKDVTVDVSIST